MCFSSGRREGRQAQIIAMLHSATVQVRAGALYPV